MDGNIIVQPKMIYHNEESIYVLSSSLNPYAEFRYLNGIAYPQLNPAMRTKCTNHDNCIQSQLSSLKITNTTINTNNKKYNSSNNNSNNGHHGCASVSQSFQAKLKTLRSLDISADGNDNDIGNPIVSSMSAAATATSARMCSPAVSALQKLFNCASIANHINNSYGRGFGTSKNKNNNGNGNTSNNNYNNYCEFNGNAGDIINECLSTTETDDGYCYAGGMRPNSSNNKNNKDNNNNSQYKGKSSSCNSNEKNTSRRNSNGVSSSKINSKSSNNSASNYTSNNNNNQYKKCANIKSALIAKKTKFWKCLEEEKWRVQEIRDEHLSTTNCERNNCSYNNNNNNVNSNDSLNSSKSSCDKSVSKNAKSSSSTSPSSLSALSTSKVATTLYAFIGSLQFHLNGNNKSNNSSKSSDIFINTNNNYCSCNDTTNTTPTTKTAGKCHNGKSSSSSSSPPSTSSSLSQSLSTSAQQQQQHGEQQLLESHKSNNWSGNDESNNQKAMKTAGTTEFYQEAAELLGLSCTFCDDCRCFDCQSGYFDCDDSDGCSEYSFMDEYDNALLVASTVPPTTTITTIASPESSVGSNTFISQANFCNNNDEIIDVKSEQEDEEEEEEEEEKEEEKEEVQQYPNQDEFIAGEKDDPCIGNDRKSTDNERTVTKETIETVSSSSSTTTTTTPTTSPPTQEAIEPLIPGHANIHTVFIGTENEPYEKVSLSSNERSWSQEQQQQQFPLQQDNQQQMPSRDNCGECNGMITNSTNKSKDKSSNLFATESAILPSAKTVTRAVNEMATTTTTTTTKSNSIKAEHQQRQQQQQQQPQEIKVVGEPTDHCVGLNELSLLDATSNLNNSCKDQVVFDVMQQK